MRKYVIFYIYRYWKTNPTHSINIFKAIFKGNLLLCPLQRFAEYAPSCSLFLPSLSFHMFVSTSCLSDIHQNLWAQRATPAVLSTVMDCFPFSIFAITSVDVRGKRELRLLSESFRLCREPPCPPIWKAALGLLLQCPTRPPADGPLTAPEGQCCERHDPSHHASLRTRIGAGQEESCSLVITLNRKAIASRERIPLVANVTTFPLLGICTISAPWTGV